ncbi:MAG: D-ribose pyranase [Desulfobacterales bacterium]|nr:D-ribose pyranase [Desulfobacterales bacterium]
MKKKGLLNAQLCKIVAELGHMDHLVIGDCGLPIPREVERVDLAVVPGLPSFSSVVTAVSREIVVQKFYVAEEMSGRNPEAYKFLQGCFKEPPMETISHDLLKEKMKRARAVVRTGEATPYANVILECGVAF